MRYIIDSPIPITKIYYKNMGMNVLIAMLEYGEERGIAIGKID